MTPPAPLRFGPYLLDVAAARLTRDGRPLALRPKAFELLVALARRPGELLTKDELLDAVWGRRFITEGVIKTAVGELRDALGDDPKQPRWIETVARRGYRFVGFSAGAVETEAAPASESRPAPAAPAAPATRAPAQGNLPAVLPPTIGRDDELAALAALLDTQRLVTIAGTSGIGKTRVAQALAAARRDDWADGVWFAELAPLAAEATDLATLCATLARTLQLGAEAATGPPALASSLQPLALLLVLDNAEHLLTPLAPLVAELLAGAPRLRLLVTSQEPLRIPGEQVFRLQPLAVPPQSDDADAARLMESGAVRLFVERVAGRMPGFGLAPQQQQAVAEICRALDGLPLALELAAARVPLLGVHGIADRLLGDSANRLRLLTQGTRTAAPRQRTLRDALQWSHDLLDDRQRRVFRRLGVFRGGFTLEAAQTVCADDSLDAWGVLDAVHALVEKSLLSVIAMPAELGAAPRFAMLESLHAYALERLAAAGETDGTRRRHVQAVRAYWARAETQAIGEPAYAWLARHLPEIDNLRAALRWASARREDVAADPSLVDDALALFGHSPTLWYRAGLTAEARFWCETVRARAAATHDAALRHGFELAVAILALYASVYPPADGLAAALLAADGLERAGDPVRAYHALGIVHLLSVRAQAALDRSALLARMDALEQPGWSELLTRHRRVAHRYELRLAGQAADYLGFCRAELARYRRLGAVAEAWDAAQGVMMAEHDIGDADAALAVGREVLAEIRAAGRLCQHAALLALWTTMLAESGDSAATRHALAETLPALQSAGTPWMAHVALAWLAAHEGRHEAAARLVGWHDAALDARTGSGSRSGAYITRSLGALGRLLVAHLDAEALAASRAAGAALGDEEAERLALDAG